MLVAEMCMCMWAQVEVMDYQPSSRELRLQRELTPEYFELWRERAAIMEVEGGMSHWKAEEQAEIDTRRTFAKNQSPTSAR